MSDIFPPQSTQSHGFRLKIPLTLLPIHERIPEFSKFVTPQQAIHHFSRLHHDLLCPIMKFSSPFPHFRYPSSLYQVLSESRLPSSSLRLFCLDCCWR